MTLQLTLPPELEERLREEAERRGQSPEAVVLTVLDQSLPPPLDERRKAAIAMLKEWMEEDSQKEYREEDEEFFRNLDADRTSNRPLFPPELKGISW
jgi:predicted transcriptional regulator